MALGSWQGFYNHVIDDLMRQQREQELLLLMAIARFADPLGFAFPGRATLMKIRHVGDRKHMERENWLVENGLLVVEEIYSWRHRQDEPHYQISPYVLYVREEFVPYCEAVFTSQKERDAISEKALLVSLSREKDSQPESYPESEPDAVTRISNQSHNQRHNQRAASKEQLQGRTTGNARRKGAQSQPAAAKQPAATQNRKKQPAGGVSDGDEFSALLSPTVDDDVIVGAIKNTAVTTDHQAAAAVRDYPREAIVHWLRMTAIRRQKGTLSSPGGWFFRMLHSQTPLPIERFPLWAQEQLKAKSGDDDLSELEI